ncbi:hypothetical protein [Rhodococcus sp. ADH]|uniref:hypothetical protein n=1 Tax=Rhodococcus sp. ADH TaxID=224843 RepID=UPI000AEA4A53|nr:hypothetical protein [Rhodococcus sp. ADH]
MSETATTAILDLKPGDIVRERNADWAEPFCNGEFYDYTVEVVERINETTVHVGIAGYTGTRASISYRIDNVVSVLKPH